MRTRQRSSCSSVALGLAMLAVVACESSTEIQVGDLEGTWVATEARVEDLEGYKLGNVDLIAAGYDVAFSSPGNGDFAIALIPPEGDPSFVSGSMVIDGTRAVFTTSEDVFEGQVFYDPDDFQLALSLTGGLTYDFSGNGNDKPAKLLVVMDQVSPEPAEL